ncbi:MAG: 1,4-dihydroxy-2-naphthoate polyprenyltransferase [Acidimicrobiia bacterium]|nr:1,4-dihydroxy-2-naphthoate polyprenyltransferase [Acidimicrobiia bacterium]
MTTAAQWVQGARPRTLGAALSPVMVGTAAASLEGPTIWWRAASALVVALALQIGVNYANDYSDGVRGADAYRRGPVRLTASGIASPRAVKRAAIVAFGVAAAVGLGLSLAADPRLLVVGAAAVAAGALYTGGPRPYGYSGLGEVMVLVFFGFVATAGSAYVQVDRVPAAAWWGSLVSGLPACAILLVNNLRDVASDRVAGKRTLVVRLGRPVGRVLFTLCLVGALASTAAIGASHRWALVGLAAAPLAVRPALLAVSEADAPPLVRALTGTVLFQVVLAALLAAGLWAS